MASKKSFTLLVASRTTPFFVVVPIFLSRIVALLIKVLFIKKACYLEVKPRSQDVEKSAQKNNTKQIRYYYSGKQNKS